MWRSILVAIGIAIVAFVIGLICSGRLIGDLNTEGLHLKFNRMKVDPFLVGGVLVSIIIALLLVILNQEPLLCVTIALLGVVLTLQIEHIIGLDKGLEKHFRFTDLWHEVDSIPMLNKRIPEIVDSVKAILTSEKNELFLDYARRKLENTTNYFKSLALGYLTTPYNDIEPLLLATQRTKNYIRAVSVFRVDGWFWDSAIGQRYWGHSLDAIARSVQIERIFVCDTMKDELKALAKRQFEAGVQVYTATRDQLPADLVQDMIIFDRDFTYRAIINADGVAVKNELSTNEADINQRISDFNRARGLADKFPDSTGT